MAKSSCLGWELVSVVSWQIPWVGGGNLGYGKVLSYSPCNVRANSGGLIDTSSVGPVLHDCIYIYSSGPVGLWKEARRRHLGAPWEVRHRWFFFHGRVPYPLCIPPAIPANLELRPRVWLALCWE